MMVWGCMSDIDERRFTAPGLGAWVEGHWSVWCAPHCDGPWICKQHEQTDLSLDIWWLDRTAEPSLVQQILPFKYIQWPILYGIIEKVSAKSCTQSDTKPTANRPSSSPATHIALSHRGIFVALGHPEPPIAAYMAGESWSCLYPLAQVRVY